MRRIFAVDVSRKRAFEWSRELGTWELLAPSASIDDHTLVAPLPIAALCEAAKADDAMAAALLAKGNPVITSAVQASRSEGKIEGKIEGLLTLLAARGLEVSDRARERIEACRDGARLDAWFRAAVDAKSVAELLERG